MYQRLKFCLATLLLLGLPAVGVSAQATEVESNADEPPVELEDLGVETGSTGTTLVEESSARLVRRREQGSVTGLFPVLEIDGCAVHESLAVCEWAADHFPDAGLWPEDSVRRAQARSACCEMMSGFRSL